MQARQQTVGERRGEAQLRASLLRAGLDPNLRSLSDEELGRLRNLSERQRAEQAELDALPRTLAFFVPGEAAPQGSKTIGRNFRRGQAVAVAPKVWVREDNRKTKPWRALVSDVAALHWGDRPPLHPHVDVSLSLLVVIARPKGHYSASAHPTREDGLYERYAGPRRHRGTPDLDKLTRAICDALKVAGVIADDAQINEYVAPFAKWYADASCPWGSRPGVHVRLEW